MGRDEDNPAENNPAGNPAHHVLVDAFFMDKTEVTNSEYAEFVRETGYVPPDDWPNDKPPIGQEQWPVTYVSLADADAFAVWRSKRDNVTYRLPTEEEWEYAARNGAQNNLYPWGDKWITNRAVTAEVGSNFPKPVGSYPEGRNRWGVLDLIGNVSEWTSSKVYLKASFYSVALDKTLPNSDESVMKDWIVIRGGSAESQSSGEKAITATRRELIPLFAKDRRIGFRLVRDKEENRDINQPVLNETAPLSNNSFNPTPR
jgi:formylglycine-generating enzyme required for sulfatase activity